MSNFSEELLNAKKSGISHKVFKNAFIPSSDFSLFFEYIEKTKIDGNYRSDFDGFYILNGVEKDDLYKFDNAKNFDEQCSITYEEPIKSRHGFSIVVSELIKDDKDVKQSGIMKHTDPHDTIHWNHTGKSLWYIYDNDGKHGIELEPGDVIYVREEIEHEVHSLSKRAGIIFCAN